MDEQELKKTQDDLDKLNKNFTIKELIKFLVTHVDVLNTVIVLVCGVAMTIAILHEAKDVATTLGGGLIGFLGKSASNNKPNQ